MAKWGNFTFYWKWLGCQTPFYSNENLSHICHAIWGCRTHLEDCKTSCRETKLGKTELWVSLCYILKSRSDILIAVSLPLLLAESADEGFYSIGSAGTIAQITFSEEEVGLGTWLAVRQSTITTILRITYSEDEKYVTLARSFFLLSQLEYVISTNHVLTSEVKPIFCSWRRLRNQVYQLDAILCCDVSACTESKSKTFWYRFQSSIQQTNRHCWSVRSLEYLGQRTSSQQKDPT